MRKLLVHTRSLAFGSRHRKKPTDARARQEKRKHGYCSMGAGRQERADSELGASQGIGMGPCGGTGDKAQARSAGRGGGLRL